MLRVLLVDDTGKDMHILRDALASAGHEVVGEVETALDLIRQVERTTPDLVIVDTESPSRDVLEQISIMSQNTPRPIVMFTDDGEQATIESAFAMTDEQLADMQRALEKRFGRKIEATVTVNPELIGGARVTVGDAVLDGSVQAKLAAMHAQLRA